MGERRQRAGAVGRQGKTEAARAQGKGATGARCPAPAGRTHDAPLSCWFERGGARRAGIGGAAPSGAGMTNLNVPCFRPPLLPLQCD